MLNEQWRELAPGVRGRCYNGALEIEFFGVIGGIRQPPSDSFSYYEGIPNGEEQTQIMQQQYLTNRQGLLAVLSFHCPYSAPTRLSYEEANRLTSAQAEEREKLHRRAVEDATSASKSEVNFISMAGSDEISVETILRKHRGESLPLTPEELVEKLVDHIEHGTELVPAKKKGPSIQ